MAKNIVFCADGTWNGPGQPDDQDHVPSGTNVLALFRWLAGELTSADGQPEMEKALHGDDGALVQVAKYLHGVGDSKNWFARALGGAFGVGVVGRIVRGYTFISRNYEDGDNIVIAGFSRGAYTARALAGLIASQGLLDHRLTVDKEAAYRYGTEAWYRYRKHRAFEGGTLSALADVFDELRSAFTRNRLDDDDLVPIQRIGAVAVWDTVGSLGIPVYVNDGVIDAFQFTDTKLSAKVERGLHAVSLDEQRANFTPTLWDAGPNVTQALFPGGHADVGGGYAERGLSDTALQWMVKLLGRVEVGVVFQPQCPVPCAPDACGTAHQEWAHAPWNALPLALRKFPEGFALDASIAARMAADGVLRAPGAPAGPYRPENLPPPA